MQLGRFNASGIAKFQAFLDSLTGEASLPWPESILSDPEYGESIEASVVLEPRQFATRFELAEYLHERFEAAPFRPKRGDAGLWSWIACFYFREICPTSRGVLQPGSLPRWIPLSSDWRRYYRHLIAGPYGIYHAHRDAPRRALAVLCQRPGRPGDLVEQLASRQQIVTNPSIMQVATDWFVDPISHQQRRNANSKGAGGPRRFVDILSQFDLTWDLSSMSPDELQGRLPQEFKSS